jgi:hypothetical protein
MFTMERIVSVMFAEGLKYPSSLKVYTIWNMIAKVYKRFSKVTNNSTCVLCKCCTWTDKISNEQKNYQFCYDRAADLSVSPDCIQ